MLRSDTLLDIKIICDDRDRVESRIMELAKKDYIRDGKVEFILTHAGVLQFIQVMVKVKRVKMEM